MNGKPVKEYYKDGKIYVESKNGTRFSIKIRNHGYRRILAVPSVDGLSVMNGKIASMKSGGYIVNGYGSLTIDGWRTSDKEVSEFFFTTPEKSYAVKTDKGGNVGVIGVAIFREKEIYQSFVQVPLYIPKSGFGMPESNTFLCSSSGGNMYGASSLSASASNASSMRSMSAQESGTGFGDSRRSEVESVSFNEEESSDAVFEVFYNSRRQLEELGVDFKEKVYINPQAFPGQFCEPPRN